MKSHEQGMKMRHWLLIVLVLAVGSGLALGLYIASLGLGMARSSLSIVALIALLVEPLATVFIVYMIVRKVRRGRSTP